MQQSPIYSRSYRYLTTFLRRQYLQEVRSSYHETELSNCWSLLGWEIRQTRYPASYLAVRCSEWQFAGQLLIALAYCWLMSRRETLILSTAG